MLLSLLLQIKENCTVIIKSTYLIIIAKKREEKVNLIWEMAYKGKAYLPGQPLKCKIL